MCVCVWGVATITGPHFPHHQRALPARLLCSFFFLEYESLQYEKGTHFFSHFLYRNKPPLIVLLRLSLVKLPVFFLCHDSRAPPGGHARRSFQRMSVPVQQHASRSKQQTDRRLSPHNISRFCFSKRRLYRQAGGVSALFCVSNKSFLKLVK